MTAPASCRGESPEPFARSSVQGTSREHVLPFSFPCLWGKQAAKIPGGFFPVHGRPVKHGTKASALPPPHAHTPHLNPFHWLLSPQPAPASCPLHPCQSAPGQTSFSPPAPASYLPPRPCTLNSSYTQPLTKILHLPFLSHSLATLSCSLNPLNLSSLSNRGVRYFSWEPHHQWGLGGLLVCLLLTLCPLTRPHTITLSYTPPPAQILHSHPYPTSSPVLCTGPLTFGPNPEAEGEPQNPLTLELHKSKSGPRLWTTPPWPSPHYFRIRDFWRVCVFFLLTWVVPIWLGQWPWPKKDSPPVP